jgi:hypothetical protein
MNIINFLREKTRVLLGIQLLDSHFCNMTFKVHDLLERVSILENERQKIQCNTSCVTKKSPIKKSTPKRLVK